MKKNIQVTLMGVMLLLFVAASIEAVNWTGAAADGNNYVTAGNWSDNTTPSTANSYYIAIHKNDVNVVNIRSIDTDAKCGSLYLGNGNDANNAKATLNVASGGKLTTSGTGTVSLGVSRADQNGIVNLDGTITTAYLKVGSAGIGNMTVNNGGKLNVTYTGAAGFTIGTSAGSNGTFTMKSGADVNVAKLIYIGYSGAGTLNMEGGNMVLGYGAALRLGISSGANGTLNISGGTVKTSAILLGYASNTSSSCNISGAADINMMNMAATMSGVTVGYAATTTGFMTVQDSAKIVTSGFTVGNLGTGTFTMEGGEIDILASGVGNNDAWFVLGGKSGGVGTLNLDGGLIKITTADIGTGFYGSGSPQFVRGTPGQTAGISHANVKKGVIKIYGDATAVNPGNPSNFAGCLSNFSPSFVPPWMTAWHTVDGNEGVIHVAYDATEGYTTVWATHLDLAQPSDHIVNLADFAVIAKDWGKTGSNLDGDIAGANAGPVDSKVDYSDVAVLAANWLHTIQ